MSATVAAAGVCSERTVTMTIAELGLTPSAVQSPDGVIVPTTAFPPVTPLTSQMTPVFTVFDTVAVNCCDPPGSTAPDAGEMLTATGGGLRVSGAVSDTLESATKTAVPLTVPGLGTADGAV